MSPRFSGSAHSQQLHEMNLFRGFDISYSAPLNRDESVEASGSAHRAISKPLTVQQLEAALLKETQMSSKMESWPVSPSNESIWTPLSGPSLWDSAVFSKVCSLGWHISVQFSYFFFFSSTGRRNQERHGTIVLTHLK